MSDKVGMEITNKDREAYKRANMLKLATWEIMEVNAGQRDKQVREFIENPPPKYDFRRD